MFPETKTMSESQSLKFLEKFYLSVTNDKTLLKDCLQNKEFLALTVDIQDKILKCTIKNPHAKKYAPPASYQKFFLRVVLDTVENYGSELSDDLIEAYANVLSQSNSTDCIYRTYLITDDCAITLQESSCFVTNSTTGLQTWEAAKYLLEWCLENTSLFQNKVILELGSGIGLLGISLTKLCHPKKYIFSDKSSDVLEVLARNMEINFEENTIKNVFEKKQLLWGEISHDDAGHLAADYLLGADIVFDPCTIQNLVETIKVFLMHGGTKCAYVASTIRNINTDANFLSQLGLARLKHEVLEFDKKCTFIYNKSSKFILYRIFLE